MSVWLAIECSNARGGLALLREDGTPLEEIAWEEAPLRQTRLFTALDELLARRNLAPTEIAGFAVGRGPGNYSGLRAALTLARGLALPRGRPVRAVSSGSALADEWFAAPNTARPLAVMGDARRGRIWSGVFHPGETAAGPRDGWQLTTPADLPRTLPTDGCDLVSPEPERLTRLPGWPAAWTPLIRRGDPTACAVGRRALNPAARPEPLTPIYLHPAV